MRVTDLWCYNSSCRLISSWENCLAWQRKMSRVTISNKWQNCKYEYYTKCHAHIHVSTLLLCHYWPLMSAVVKKFMLLGVTPCNFVLGTVTICRPGSSVDIATDYGLDSPGSNFPPIQTGPGAHPASCKMGTGSFPGVKCGQGVLLTTHPLLVPRSWKSRAIPLPTLWATPGL